MRFRLARPGTTGVRIHRVEPGGIEERPDELATEEPLEIRLIQEDRRRTVAVTMRTPGADSELALGFLFAEGVIHRRAEVVRVASCAEPGEACANIVEVELAADVPAPELAGLERHFFATSACGVCGKAGLENLQVRVTEPLPPGPEISPEVIAALPARLREAQGLFT